jgi:hypothetical protein
MKARVKLRLQENAMLKRCELRERRENRRRQKKAAQRVADQPSELKRRIAALVLSHERGWSAEKIAHQFGWKIDDVEGWLVAGKGLR